jgi:hypothetical protein
LGRDFDGVIVFDEAHSMQNAAGAKGERGEQAPSQQGRAGLRLQHALPNARVVYVSATGATTVHNLAYAQRLGLWGGADFPFASRAEFVEAIEAGGVAAMEVLARDLKALGLYAARSLSYEGIEYEMVEHRLIPEQIRIIKPMERPPMSLAAMAQTYWREADRNEFVYAWEAEIAALPAFTDSTLHAVTGLPVTSMKNFEPFKSLVRIKSVKSKSVLHHFPLTASGRKCSGLSAPTLRTARTVAPVFFAVSRSSRPAPALRSARRWTRADRRRSSPSARRLRL